MLVNIDNDTTLSVMRITRQTHYTAYIYNVVPQQKQKDELFSLTQNQEKRPMTSQKIFLSQQLGYFNHVYHSSV